MGSVKLNLDGCSLGNLGQLEIRGMLMDHHGTLLKVFFKTIGAGLAIEADILTLLEGLKHVKVEVYSTFL